MHDGCISFGHAAQIYRREEIFFLQDKEDFIFKLLKKKSGTIWHSHCLLFPKSDQFGCQTGVEDQPAHEGHITCELKTNAVYITGITVSP